MRSKTSPHSNARSAERICVQSGEREIASSYLRVIMSDANGFLDTTPLSSLQDNSEDMNNFIFGTIFGTDVLALDSETESTIIEDATYQFYFDETAPLLLNFDIGAPVILVASRERGDGTVYEDTVGTHDDGNLKNVETIERHHLQTIYESAKEAWAWGKSLGLVGVVFSIAEGVAESVAQATAGGNLVELERNLIQPQLESIDEIATPAVDAMAKVLLRASAKVLPSLFRPVLKYFWGSLRYSRLTRSSEIDAIMDPEWTVNAKNEENSNRISLLAQQLDISLLEQQLDLAPTFIKTSQPDAFVEDDSYWTSLLDIPTPTELPGFSIGVLPRSP
jgi:hypothetical protein